MYQYEFLGTIYKPCANELFIKAVNVDYILPLQVITSKRQSMEV